MTTVPTLNYVHVDFWNRTNSSVVIDPSKLFINQNRSYLFKVALLYSNEQIGSEYNLLVNVKWHDSNITTQPVKSNSSFIGVVIDDKEKLKDLKKKKPKKGEKEMDKQQPKPKIYIGSLSQLGLLKIKVDEEIAPLEIASAFSASSGRSIIKANETVNTTINGVPID